VVPLKAEVGEQLPGKADAIAGAECRRTADNVGELGEKLQDALLAMFEQSAFPGREILQLRSFGTDVVDECVEQALDDGSQAIMVVVPDRCLGPSGQCEQGLVV
jgi:hypothetical protein